MGAQRTAQTGTQRPAHNGRTEACLERAQKRPVPNGDRGLSIRNGCTAAYLERAHRGLPRTRAREACPGSRMGAQRPAHDGRTEAYP